MTNFSDPTLPTLQADVQRALGRCLLELQRYELGLKAILEHTRPNGRTVPNQTLGTAAASFLDQVLVRDRAQVDAAIQKAIAGPDPMSFGVQLQIPEPHRSQIDQDLKALVTLRNQLVHHFLSKYDLGSVEGCRAALLSLADDSARIDQHLGQLVTWAEAMDRSYSLLADIMRSDWLRTLLVDGLHPDGCLDWPRAGITHAFLCAAADLSEDGWTPLAEATKWIAKHQPNQTPARYGCASWRQVVHKAPTLELRYFGKGTERIAKYRPKTARRSPGQHAP